MSPDTTTQNQNNNNNKMQKNERMASNENELLQAPAEAKLYLAYT